MAEKEKTSETNQDPARMPFTEHLEELRKRLIYCLIAIGIGFVACYTVKERIFTWLTQPLLDALPEGQGLIFTGLTEPFFAYLKVALLGGVVLAIPVISYQVWRFVGPGLYDTEKKMVLPLVVCSCFFFLLGASFGYFLVFPLGFTVLLAFASDSMQALPSVKEYLSLATKLLLAFGLVFELPLFVSVFARFGLVSVESLKKNRKYALVAFLIFGAMLTPPDVITQLLMAMPMMVLWEVGILGAMIFGKKKQKEPDAT
ncbi:MAG: twin-arginine translocase subunit TatC [Desulfatibacillaceae bacterium]|nr:twin-arginine translocase subunit TatC [Desulfatibacillaceae bacterium]